MRLRQKIEEMLRAQLIVAAVLTGGLQGLGRVWDCCQDVIKKIFPA
jgi:hypothetical protein